ncbi:MAG TPA: hypothetical protein VF188_16785, partial [Longimicrobiales bacterium]
MRRPTRNGLLLIVSLCAAAVGCGPRGSGPGPDIGRAVARGRAAAAGWVEQGREAAGTTAEATIALGYLERLRLGLGSPFRLIDFALHDPRLEASTRRRLGWALLARTLDGEAYRIDAAALDRIGLAGVGARPGVGRYHLELIEGAVSESRDPRGGELAVRLAYALAAAAGDVRREAVTLAAQAAALIVDRELARADAMRLIRVAEATDADPLRLLSTWRAERRFQVGQPPLAPMPLDVEREAMQLAPRLAMAINALAPRLGGGAAAATEAAPTTAPLPGPAAARHMAALADSLNAPPQTAITVAVDVHRYELLDGPGLTDAERGALERFIERARNEERFAAEYALLGARGTRSAAGTLARIALMAAVGLRPFAQEPVWFPGFGGPSTRELEDRFGLAFVRFDRDVPAAWRPFYRRVLVDALADLQRVLPALDLRGLGIHFGESRSKAATLAIHDPRRRTIYLPPATGAGTIAHEVAHDLDWQVALRRYRVRGDYGSDRATRAGLDRDRLAISVRRLSTARLLPPIPGDPAPVAHDRRPAEVFARSIDWFVAVSLARNGRINGYLSSVQDELLTGYGTVTPPDITGEAGRALVSILDEVAPLYPETREWFLRSYGPERAPTAYDLVRRIVEADLSAAPRTVHGTGEDEPAEAAVELSVMSRAAARFDALAAARDRALAAIDDWVCATPGTAYDARVEIARRRLVARVTTARGRGLALRIAEHIAGADGRAWLARKLYGAPWPAADVDSATAALLTELADRVAALDEPEHSRTFAA